MLAIIGCVWGMAAVAIVSAGISGYQAWSSYKAADEAKKDQAAAHQKALAGAKADKARANLQFAHDIRKTKAQAATAVAIDNLRSERNASESARKRLEADEMGVKYLNYGTPVTAK